MNGENWTVLVDTHLGNPTGLTVDHWMDNRVYWCDSKLSVIESMKADGSDRVIVISVGMLFYQLTQQFKRIVIITTCAGCTHDLAYYTQAAGIDKYGVASTLTIICW